MEDNLDFTEFDSVDKRRNPSGNKHYSIKTLWESHHEIARLLLLGYKASVIAETIGCTKATVSNVRNSPQMKRKLQLMRMERDGQAIDISQRLKEIAPIAVRVLEDVMTSALEAVGENGVERYLFDKDIRRDAIVASKAVVDHVHEKKIHASVLHGYVSLSDIREAKRRALESGSEIDDVEEVEVEDEEIDVSPTAIVGSSDD